MTIGKRLKSVREERGLSQSEVGKLTKMHPQDISRYENNGSIPSVLRLKSLAQALQISTDYLIFDGEKKEEVEFSNPEIKERFLSVNKMGKEDQKIILSLIDAYIARGEMEGILKKRQTKK